MKVALYSLLSLCLLAAPVWGQQKAGEKQNPLVDGKLMFVGHMPDHIDSWIIQDLRAWGKYKPTREIEGVDLVMKAYKPEAKTHYEMREGIPQPQRVPKDRRHQHILFSIGVNDWVTGRLVWQAEVLNRKPKRKNNPPPSEDAEIRVRGLSTEQIAQAITRELRRYVNHLAAEQDGKR